MTTDTEISLKYFFIFNSSFGQKEGEEEQKIFYFYPAKTDIDTQIRSVGLIEALIKFTETFNCDSNGETLHTQQTRQLYFQPEEGFWMVMVLNIPSKAKTKEGVEYMETQNEDVQDNVYHAVLRQIYTMFRLFHGTLTTLLKTPDDDMCLLRQKLEQFMSGYLAKLQLQHCDILNIFQGVQFLPLTKQPFLHVQCVVKLLECLFPSIKYTAFLYNDQLVWSGLEPNDMQIVYRYLVTSLLPAQIVTELKEATASRQSLSSSVRYGRFATGPSNLQKDDLGDIPKVHLCCNEEEPKVYQLVVYRALSATVCLFIDGAVTLDMEFFRGLDAFLESRLIKLASEIATQCGTSAVTASSSADPRFVYYNHLNRAQKSTVHLDNRQTGNIAVPGEVLRIFADVNADFSKRNPPTAEIMVRTMNDFWVVGKMSNLREFYVVIHQKNYNFIQIHEEVRKLCDTQFKSIFFND